MILSLDEYFVVEAYVSSDDAQIQSSVEAVYDCAFH